MSKALLSRVALLSTPAAIIPALRSLELRFGKRTAEGAAALRKFNRKYVPLLSYANENLTVKRVSLPAEGPSTLVASYSDGRSATIGGAGDKASDKAMFAELTGAEVDVPELTRAKPKARRKKVVAQKGAATAPVAPAADDD